MKPSILLFGTEWGYTPPRSPSRLDELLGFYVANAGRDGTLRAVAAVVCGATGIGASLGLVTLDDKSQVPIDLYATAAMDAIHASNALAKAKGAEAPRAYATGRQLVDAAGLLVEQLRKDAPILDWEVAEAVGNSVAPPTS